MSIHDTTISTLNDLIETSKDGEYGFRASADYIRDPQIKQLFLDRAEACARSVQELQALVVSSGGKPEDSGSAVGALHRGWVAVKGTLAGYTDVAILEETERGEDKAMEAYRKALKAGLPPHVQAVVERQFDGVKLNHAQVRGLRDRARADKV
jgi:uncharacterized protein (TIGR02284 family)